AGDLAERRPFLAAVEHPAVAGVGGGGLDALGVAAGVGLGEGQGPQQLAAGHARQVSLLLLAAPPPLDGVGRHVVHGEQRAQGGAALGDLLGEQAVDDHVAAAAAELRRYVGAEIAALAQAADDVRRNRLLAVPAA